MEHESFFLMVGGAMLEQAEDEGQSPQEQPREISPHEYVETFIGLIPDDSVAFGRNVIAYGEPGRPRGAFLPINANHSDKNNLRISIVCYSNWIRVINCIQATPVKMKILSCLLLPQSWSLLFLPCRHYLFFFWIEKCRQHLLITLKIKLTIFHITTTYLFIIRMQSLCPSKSIFFAYMYFSWFFSL